jgi:hypothetical protein
MLWFARPWHRDRPPLVTAAIRLGLEENGLREPIVVEGKIRDGRNRFCACGELGIQPELEYFNGGAPAVFVLSMNLHRRHLTTSQRAMIAAEIATYKQGRPAKDTNLHVLPADAAQLLNVSRRTVATAAKPTRNQFRPPQNL